MLKLKASKKDFKGETVLSVGYCGLQSLLSHKSPFAYSSGVNGWSCDYYNINGVIISTGYGPIGVSMNYDVIKEYEKKADHIRNDYNTPYELRCEKLDNLLNELVKEFKESLNK